MENYEIITLNCFDCENSDCQFCPNGTYVPEDSKRGCTRKVSEEDAAKFYHYITEVLPFLYTNTEPGNNTRIYNQAIDFFQYIYTNPIGQLLNKKGKIIDKPIF